MRRILIYAGVFLITLSCPSMSLSAAGLLISPQDFQARLFLEQAEKERRPSIEEGKAAMVLEFMAERDAKYRYIFNYDLKDIANKATVNAMGLIDQAETAYRRSMLAIQVKPKNPQPYVETGRILFESGDLAKAKEYFDKYTALGGEEAKVKAILSKK